jgi:hypothetical protein
MPRSIYRCTIRASYLVKVDTISEHTLKIYDQKKKTIKKTIQFLTISSQIHQLFITL